MSLARPRSWQLTVPLLAVVLISCSDPKRGIESTSDPVTEASSGPPVAPDSLARSGAHIDYVKRVQFYASAAIAVRCRGVESTKLTTVFSVCEPRQLASDLEPRRVRDAMRLSEECEVERVELIRGSSRRAVEQLLSQRSTKDQHTDFIPRAQQFCSL